MLVGRHVAAAAVSAMSAVMLGPAAVSARDAPPAAFEQSAVPAVAVSPGVTLQELTGFRTAAPSTRSTMGSVALFRLDPGRASAWSRNRLGEESFFVLTGHGDIWTGSIRHPVGPGSFMLIPPAIVRSVRASPRETLTFYAVTTPAWTPQDDVRVAAPSGAPD